MAKSTRASAQRKPPFPLWLHSGSGQWAKKLTVGGRKRTFYFGTDKDAALAEYLRTKDDLKNGRPRRSEPTAQEGLTLRDLCNHFRTHKLHQAQTGELTQRSFQDYEDTCQRALDHFGKGVIVAQLLPSDLLGYRRKLAETRGPHGLGTEVTRVRVLLRFAFEAGLIDKPIRFGEFKRPKKSAFRRAKAESGDRMFTPEELRTILAAADPHMRAMVYLGLNCGFGNSDCGQLPRRTVDLGQGWIDFPRPKTGVPRRCPLWPETVRALKASLSLRQTPKNPDDERLTFITKYGLPWHRDDGKRSSPLSAEFRKLLVKLGLYRPGLSFYALRHCFATIGSETGDETAVKIVMGHADHSMLGQYRERFPDERLQRVVDHVRGWLLSGATEEERRAMEGGAE